MRKLIVAAFTSLDGVIQAPGGPEEDTSGELVRQLLAAGLVDELRLLIHPIILGRGKRWFDDQAHASAFTLAQSSSTPSGVLVARYVLNGEVRTGSFA
ncbi:dihydrofolate reductase family protein [Pseudomonas donghuensis]|uniref:dihydrofolate reductase family protein n=1 Tax=Pseudomonas donghuensis TaxID=1163398 RepID=UPI002E0EE43D|nr:dihydrofolate reductase family protein [Pseudomonas donghuensis]